MTEQEVRRIVADMLGMAPGGDSVGWIQMRGNVSKKMIGECVADAGARQRYVLVDLSGATRISGRKPWWRP